MAYIKLKIIARQLGYWWRSGNSVKRPYLLEKAKSIGLIKTEAERQNMQTKSRPLDDLTNLFTNAVGAVKGVGDEVKAMGRSQAERLIEDMDLITRDEFEVLKAQMQNLAAENEKLKKTVSGLEKKLKTAKK
ncbi:MAG: accessory factor UbiK family protein [Hellea sp.]|nr:accessory factor UbiK family protein [Hellea sp.]